MTLAETTLEAGSRLVKPWAREVREPEPHRLDVDVEVRDVVPAISALLAARWGYLSALTGTDPGPESGEVEVLYHLCSGPDVLTLRTRVAREGGTLPTVCGLIPSATVFERELIEMFGVRVEGTPDPRRLYLPDDWPAGLFPLRKDADLERATGPRPHVSGDDESAATAPADGSANGRSSEVHSFEPRPRGPGPETRDRGGDRVAGRRFTIPIGPQHPALKEPGHFELEVDGEVVTAASVRLGYAHRGIEKAAESRSYIQDLYLLERVCGICSHIHATAYCLGVEKLAGVVAPPRAQAIRQLVAELERIHSHLLWLGVAAHEAGFETLFMYSWRDRESVMDVLESLTGNRVNYSANVLGGVKCDVDAEQASGIHKAVDFLEERTRVYLEQLVGDETFVRRTRGIGSMTAEQAEAFGVVGPLARASGVVRDLRVDAPYAGYADFPIQAVVEQSGDLFARVVVRLEELFESYRAIRLVLDNLPDGELVARMPRRIPAGETISRVEAPRGELLYYIKSNGTEKPERIKVRTPTICNMGSVIAQAVGQKLADVPMLVAGIDPCFSCNDRAVTIRRPGDEQRWTWARLRQHGIEFYR